MEKMMRAQWWKILSVMLVTLCLIVGMLIPLKPNLQSVTPRAATPGETVVLEVTGYNTSFVEGETQAWLRAAPELSLPATNVRVLDARRAELTFAVPRYVPRPERGKQTYAIIVNTNQDGAFVDPLGLTVRETEPAPSQELAEAPWRANALQKGDLTATPYTTFPFRGHLAETIRNTYFHVSLWFAMIFV
ncbi:MAG: cytochrome c assembly protein, partial [Bacteroidota bacterium]